MNIIEAILELERQRDVAKEKGFDPCGIQVLIPLSGTSRMEWEELQDSELQIIERGTVAELLLRG